MLRELLAHPGVVEDVRLHSHVGVMALHGGIEDQTAELATEVATATGASLYAVIQPDDLAWHVPSIRYRRDESEGLAGFLQHVRVVLSIHGFGRKHLPHTVLVGGGNRSAAALVATTLREHSTVRVIDDLEEIPRGLRGCHADNPVNQPVAGGVQLELSASVRTEPERSGLVAGITRSLRQLEAVAVA